MVKGGKVKVYIERRCIKLIAENESEVAYMEDTLKADKRTIPIKYVKQTSQSGAIIIGEE